MTSWLVMFFWSFQIYFSLGMIEDGIKKGKNMETRVRTHDEMKENVFDEHVRVTIVERQDKRKFGMMLKESIKNHFHSSPHTCTSVPFAQSPSPQMFN